MEGLIIRFDCHWCSRSAVHGHRIVPQRQVFVVERLGKFQTSLDAGLHFLMPFIDRVAYKHSLKEIVRDARQSCITRTISSVH